MLDALDAHPNIEVRLFNPFHTRKPSLLSKVTQFLLDAHRLNRRMHNKSYIVDGNVAIVGGRNIGDAYFDASNDTNFRDLDLIAIGPVVKQASHAFDEYWNCDAALPVQAFQRQARQPLRPGAAARGPAAATPRSSRKPTTRRRSWTSCPNGPSGDRPRCMVLGRGNAGRRSAGKDRRRQAKRRVRCASARRSSR